ncbi:kinase-like domain-containing protein [Daldinia sp. FL1419]|nr:kinase-like domain-containing protein [Daldinia sp. FL1419]
MLVPRSSPNIIAALQTRLDDCLLNNESGKLFMPNGTLESLLDETTVAGALSELPVFRDKLLGNPEEYVRRICNREYPFRKIFALLLLTDIPEAIVQFVDRSIHDLTLPMPDPRLVISCKYSGTHDHGGSGDENKWKYLGNSQLSRSCLGNIYARQWCLLSPHFSRREEISHSIFTHDYILPFLRNDSGHGTSGPSHSSEESVRHGSFSQVRRVKIHPNHYDFGDYGVSNPDRQFAVKKLWTPDYEDFAQEIKVFKRHWKSGINIVPLLATYEIRETISDNPLTSYCMIFPWAAGDLRSFWEMNEGLVRDHKVLPWMARECYEIARALSYIHGYSHDSTTPEDSFGRHGDIKPSNILWFPNKDGESDGDFGKLVLSDFGLADFHRAGSRTNSRTSSLPRSMTYRAPEFDLTKVISRAIDTWSLGCTFLEFITWFLRGNEAVRREFTEFRMEVDAYGINSDTYFAFQYHEGDKHVVLKPQVVAWIERLRKDELCNGYIEELLDIVQCGMLVVDRSTRWTSGKISRRLQGLWSTCAQR